MRRSPFAIVLVGLLIGGVWSEAAPPEGKGKGHNNGKAVGQGQNAKANGAGNANRAAREFSEMQEQFRLGERIGKIERGVAMLSRDFGEEFVDGCDADGAEQLLAIFFCERDIGVGHRCPSPNSPPSRGR